MYKSSSTDIPIQVLDCTFRDGGYYNSWNYTDEVISNYFHALKHSGIDIVELGLRSWRKKAFTGPFAYTHDEFIKSLDYPKNMKIAVMINSSEYMDSEKQVIEQRLQFSFQSKANSPVDIVRIAAHFSELDTISPMIKWLHGQGYRVFLNIMQIANYSEDEISKKVAKIALIDELEVLYFADSMGSMNPREISKMVETLRINWKGELGIHTHDNMGNAVQNSMEAIRLGVKYIDSTILGMGRGAGNAKTERLLLEINREGHKPGAYHPEALFPIVLGDFKELQKQYDWGSSLLYHLSALYNIHPTYIQEIVQNNEGDIDYLINAIEQLRGLGSATSFSRENLNSLGKSRLKSSEGTWNPAEVFQGREVLIIGSGPGIENNLKGIQDYIKNNSPVVLSLNINPQLEPSYIDYYVASHPIRIVSEISKYKGLGKKLITPYESLTLDAQKSLNDLDYLNYGLKLDSGHLKFNKTHCCLRTPLAIGYTLSLINSGKASRAILVGFDGYGASDPRQTEMNQLLAEYHELPNTTELIAATPTTYNITQDSIYSPFLSQK